MSMITKADVSNVRVCTRRAFFARTQPHLAAPFSKSDLARFEQGRAIGKTARRAFNGTLVTTHSSDIERAADETAAAILRGDEILFEPAFIADDCVARPDVLRRLQTGEWELIEVKSTLSVKPEHVWDAAFQVYVLESAGAKVAKVGVMHLSPEFRTPADECSAAEMFIIDDVTQQALDASKEVAGEVERLRAVLRQESRPEVVPNTHCKATSCPFIDHCFAELPEFDVVSLPRVSSALVSQMHEEGTRDLRTVPPTSLSPRQRLIQSVVRSGKPHIDACLLEELKQFVAPIAFVDFEAESEAVSSIRNLKPFTAVPFQWSIHVVTSDRAEARHMEFLHTSNSDPRSEFANSLLFALQGAKTIVTYSPYEKTRIKALVEADIPCAKELDRLFRLSVDLLRTVEKSVYFLEFKGKTTVKTVYPALVPGAGYTDLEIRDGSAAASEYRRMVSAGTTEEEASSIAKNLKEYCKRDTLAMVQIYQRLCEIAHEANAI